MILDTQYRKVKSISEGNFHSCYASNKAEKFKFNRLSQGLESCAQAQSLKLRKEEKSLQKIFEHLQKEKEKHHLTRESNKVYLKQQNGSTHRLPHRDSTGGFHGEKHKSKRQEILEEKFACDYHEVTPFYMEHGYTQYHHDSFYDHLLEASKSITFSVVKDEDEPSWKEITPLAICKRRHSLPKSTHFPIPTELSPLSECDVRSEVSSASPTTSIKVNEYGKISPNSLQLPSLSKSLNVLPSIQTSLERKGVGVENQSVLTPVERQELAKHNRRTGLPFHTARNEARVKVERHRRCSIPVTPKVLCLKSLLLNKLREGKKIDDLVDDPAFSNVLEVCDDHRIYPAYDPEDEDDEVLPSDFRQLRKCKYLRLSNLNIRSMKQLTLEELANI